MSSWKMEHCLPFSPPARHFWAAVQFSFFIPNVEKLFSPALVSWQPPRPGLLWPEPFRKTAADRDKNNYSSICLPRDTLSTRPTPFPYELLHFRSPAHTIKPFTIKTPWLNVLTQARMFHHAGWERRLYAQEGNSTLFWQCLYFVNQCKEPLIN